MKPPIEFRPNVRANVSKPPAPSDKPASAGAKREIGTTTIGKAQWVDPTQPTYAEWRDRALAAEAKLAAIAHKNRDRVRKHSKKKK
jgi:hypothetical protein